MSSIKSKSPAAEEAAKHDDERGAAPSPSLSGEESGEVEEPPLPDEAPPLPEEAVPEAAAEDDGWDAQLDAQSGRWWFFNRFTGVRQWENPRVPDSSGGASAGAAAAAKETASGAAGGYNPAIHGDWDPNADYAKAVTGDQEESSSAAAVDPNGEYSATATFNKFTGRFQAPGLTTENFSDASRAQRQLGHHFDVTAAANTHDGRSLKAERSGKKISKKQHQAYTKKKAEQKAKKIRQFYSN